MSDHRLDDAIRDALLTDDPGKVPGRLRARMAMIPGETARQASAGWRGRLATFALPAVVMAAVTVIAVVFGGIALRGQQTATAVPSVAPSAPQGSAPASVPSMVASTTPSADASSHPSPSATTPTSAPTGPITIDPSLVMALQPGTFAVRDNVAYRFNRIGVSGWATLSMDSPAGSSTTTNLVELKNGHDIASYALTDAGIVWMETWYTGKAIDCSNRTPCAPHEYQPISWALNLTTPDGATTTKLDGGVVSRTSVEGQLASPLPPEMAAQGSRVAYAVPRLNVPGEPEASTIIVRSLPGGDVVRTMDTHGYVAQLGVFGQALIYREAPDTAGAGTVDVSLAWLFEVASDTAIPQTIDSSVADASIGDGGVPGNVRIAWTRDPAGHPGFFWIDPGGSSPASVQASDGSQSAGRPVVVGDGFAWLVQVPGAAGAWSSAVDVWRPGWGQALVVDTLGSPESISASGDMLLVSGTEVPVLQQLSVLEGSVPASALFGGQ